MTVAGGQLGSHRACRSEYAARRERVARNRGSHKRQDGFLDFLEIVRERGRERAGVESPGRQGCACTGSTATMNTREGGRDEAENSLSNQPIDCTKPSPKATSSSSETTRCRSHLSWQPGSRQSSFLQVLTSRSEVRKVFLPTTLGWGPPLSWWPSTLCR